MFVDLPGYGYAKVPQKVRAGWAAMIEEFLLEPGLRLVVLIVDARHRPTQLDRQMVQWMSHNKIPFQVVATKADKVRKSMIARNLARIAEDLEAESILPFSSVTSQGRKELIQQFKAVCTG